MLAWKYEIRKTKTEDDKKCVYKMHERSSAVFKITEAYDIHCSELHIFNSYQQVVPNR